MSQFLPRCLPLLIGSLPYEDHKNATDVIFEYTPEYPLWPQLPMYKQEGMILQYTPGFPGVKEIDGKVFIDATTEVFEADLLAFYEEYLMITEAGGSLEGSRFELSVESAKGFYAFLDKAQNKTGAVLGLKGQTTGPVTFCTGLVDQDGRAIFYNDQLRDVAIKHLAMKARWQTKKMAEIGGQPIMFFDEPGLAGLGTSAFITITKEDIVACLGEVFDSVKTEGGLTGVHVCANTEWPVIFESGVDIISYDAYSYFDRLVLFGDHLVKFFKDGGILASGIVPTTPELIDVEQIDSLVTKWFEQTNQLVALGIDEKTVFEQTLITPSCGTGTVTVAQAEKVLQMTRGVSQKVRQKLS